MSQENPASHNFCLHCKHDKDQRLKRLTELEHSFQSVELQRRYQEQREKLEKYAPCLQCCEAIVEQHNVICSLCILVQQECSKKDPAIKELEQKCAELRSDCKSCDALMHEIQQKDQAIEDLKKNCAESKSEADINKKKLEDFKERMSVDVSAEMGCSSDMFEDINNPCRESELRKRYDTLKNHIWANCVQQIRDKRRRGEISDESKEKETVERMIKKVFNKASADMKKKRDSLQPFFKISDREKSVNNKKLYYMDMAVQNLQMIILYEDYTHYQDMNEELGHKNPDYLCELADNCYKQGCLMALHNPPLILDWNNKHGGCPFPQIKLEKI